MTNSLKWFISERDKPSIHHISCSHVKINGLLCSRKLLLSLIIITCHAVLLLRVCVCVWECNDFHFVKVFFFFSPALSARLYSRRQKLFLLNLHLKVSWDDELRFCRGFFTWEMRSRDDVAARFESVSAFSIKLDQKPENVCRDRKMR